MSGPDVEIDVVQDDPGARLENVDEAQLVDRAKTVPQAFGQLYELYYGRILRYVYRRTLDAAVAEELTSNTFFKALRALPEYDHRGHFAAWLYRIATNEIQARRRTASSRREGNHPCPEELGRVYFASQGPDGEDVEEKMRAFAQLHEALCRLPDKYQVVLSLRYFEAMPYAEIAKVLGKKLGTVKSLIHRGLKQLKRRYRREPQEEDPSP
ncbi:MAG: RNA polymerase sigma factor [Planctomycetota bacterium]|jgi:RNA polymerase sigma-70 factor (ECF subfamily)